MPWVARSFRARHCLPIRTGKAEIIFDLPVLFLNTSLKGNLIPKQKSPPLMALQSCHVRQAVSLLPIDSYKSIYGKAYLTH